MDRWGFEHLRPWLELRPVPVGPLFSVIDGAPPAAARGRPPQDPRPTAHRWPPTLAYGGGSRHISFATGTRSSWPVKASRSIIQHQHADLGITSVYLRGIDNTEIVHAVHERPAPMISATNGLRLAR